MRASASFASAHQTRRIWLEPAGLEDIQLHPGKKTYVPVGEALGANSFKKGEKREQGIWSGRQCVLFTQKVSLVREL